MLTGDNERTAEKVAKQLGIESVCAELMPEDKVEQVEEFMESQTEGEKVAFVGDGINDAPVLARADIGIAMGGLGADAALEAADIILMEDEPSRIINAIRIAKGHTAVCEPEPDICDRDEGPSHSAGISWICDDAECHPCGYGGHADQHTEFLLDAEISGIVYDSRGVL